MWKRCVSVCALLISCQQDKEPTNASEAVPALRPSQPAPAEPESLRACAEAPAWASALAAERCAADGYLYAAGAGSKIPNGALLLHVAGDRARASLVGGGTSELRGSEVVDLARCGDVVWALARRPVGAGESYPACDAAIEARAHLPEGCPEWSTALSTLDGETVNGVGYVFGDSSKPLIQSAARNRALNEQRKSLGLRVTRGEHDSLDVATIAREVTLQLDAETAACGEMTVARVTSRVVKRP